MKKIHGAFLSVKYASPQLRTSVFLLFPFLVTVSSLFINNAVKFIAFDITYSQSIVSLLGTIFSIAFITVGLFAEIIVDAFSRKRFATLPLLFMAALAVLFYIAYLNAIASIGLLFIFILLKEVSSTFNSAARRVIFL